MATQRRPVPLQSTSIPTAVRVDRRPEPGRFFDRNCARTIKGMVLDIVQGRGPIHFGAVAREITQLHGWKRVGGRTRTQIADCSKAPARTEEPQGVFLWPGSPEPAIHWRDMPDRDPSETPIAEFAGLLAAEPRLRHTENAALAFSRRLELSRLAAFAAATQRLDGRSP